MAFNKDIPAASTTLRVSNPQILENQDAIQEAVDNEHEFAGTSAGTQEGYHVQGSARPFYQSGEPATRIDGSAFESTDLGLIWIDSDDGAWYSLSATTPTWTKLSDEVITTLLASPRVFLDTLGVTGDFAVNTDKFNVTAASGNTAIAGTLDVVGNIDPTSYDTANGGFKDEDTMSSNSATAVSSQQSIKAYIDTLLAASGAAKAYGNFNGSDGALRGNDLNITQVNRNSAGNYTVIWDTNFSVTNYTVIATPGQTNRIVEVSTKTNGQTVILTENVASTPSDCDIEIAAFGPQ